MQARFANVKMKLFILLVSISVINCAKLNVPKLLLPYYSDVATNFTLEVSEGCFHWRSTRPEIAAIQMDSIAGNGEDCSDVAVVVTTSRVPSRKTAVIIAHDPVSHTELRCDVIVDVIHALALETTTRELYLDDSPEEFVIRASNDEGDIFSTLGGFIFEWNLLPDTEARKNMAPANNILRFIPYAESNYEALPHIEALEEAGRRGDRILVRGMNTGSAKVTVRPADSALKLEKDPVVRIIVMANIQLNPPLVYLLQYTQVSYQVHLIKQNAVSLIDMPHEQYYLEVKNSEIARMNADTSTATALALGDTDVLLKYHNIHVGGMFREPSAGIYVVTPAYLDFTVLPGRNWVLQTDRIYEITIDIYDKESHKIYPSDNIRIEATFPSKYFEVHQSSANGSHHVVKTLEPGLTQIAGLFQIVILEDGTQHIFTPPVQNWQHVEIYDPVIVQPKLVVLPWLPHTSKHHNSFQLQAKGGSGNYTWTSTMTDVATVTTQGQVVTAKETGETVVKAADSKNLAHFDTMQTMVLPPGSMEFVKSRVEAEIGTSLLLPLAVFAHKGSKRLAFAECHLMPFTVYADNEAIFSTHQKAKAPDVPGSCASIRVDALSLGHTKLTVSYEYNPKLNASVLIAAYKPLRAVDPEFSTLVTLAASRELVFTGGPQPWVREPSSFDRRMREEKPELVTVSQSLSDTKAKHKYRVLCTEFGKQTLTLTVGNRPSATNPFPASATTSVDFLCREPRNLQLVPLVDQPIGLPPCPIDPLYDNPVYAQNYLDLDLQLIMRDDEGFSFDNFSSLALDWTLSDLTLAEFPGDDKLTTELMPGEERAEMISYRNMKVKEIEGQLEISVSANSYNSAYLKEANLDVSSLELSSTLSDTRALKLVDDAHIKPGALTMYNHKTHEGSLRIEKGSGHFHVSSSTAHGAHVQVDKSRDIRVWPREEGEFNLEAQDLCLEMNEPARARVIVSDVHEIILNVLDKVEIHKSIEASVQVLDRRGQPIPAKYFEAMGLKPMHDDIIALKLKSTKAKSSDTTAIYTVLGASLGNTRLQFVASSNHGKEHVTSASRDIQVFPPLRLEPCNSTIIIGAVIQIAANGGPQPQSTIEFDIQNDKIGSVSNSGLMEALTLGSTRITGRAVGLNADNSRVVYSEDSVIVNVVMLEGIRIFAPLKRLETGTQMPLYALGLGDNETPFTFGSANPPLKFNWALSGDVASLQPLFYKSGITASPDNDFSVRFLAARPGHVTVKLSVEPPEGSSVIRHGKTLINTVQIQVYEKLRMTSPDVCDGTLLITPNTRTKLKTNRDGSAAHLSYSIQNGKAAASTVSVDEFGYVATGSQEGTASILVTAHEPNGVNQSLVVQVKVRSVSYVMVHAESVFRVGPGLERVPLGATLDLSVSFHTSSGQKFHTTNSKIAYRPHRFDLLQLVSGAENDTLVARATNAGHTVIKVWDSERPSLVDYVGIHVGDVISPSNSHVTVGDLICLASPLLTPSGRDGSWKTDNGAVAIDSASGVAMATHVGNAVVTYNVSNSLATHTQISVTPISKISLTNTEENRMLTNAPSQFPDIYLSTQMSDVTGNVINSHVHGQGCKGKLGERKQSVAPLPVRCEVLLSNHNPHVLVNQLVSVATEFDTDEGSYRCRVTQIEAQASLVSQVTSHIQVRAHVIAREGQSALSSEPVTLTYIPRYHVMTTQLLLSTESPVVKLRISATEQVLDSLRVTALDESMVSIGSAEKDHVGNIASFPVKLIITSSLWDRSQLETNIEIVCPLTGAHERITIRVQLVGSKEAQQKLVLTWRDVLVSLQNTDWYQLLFLILAVIATLACLLIAYHVVLGGRYTAASQQSGVFVSPNSSPSNQPQPFNTTLASPWSQSVLNTSGSSPPRLWSVDHGPYEHASMFKRSPLQSSPRS